MRAITKQQGPSRIRDSSVGVGTRLLPATYINPIGWHHATEAYHIPHSSLYKPRLRLPGFPFGFLTAKDGTNRLSRNVSNKLPPLRRARFIFLLKCSFTPVTPKLFYVNCDAWKLYFPFLFFNDCEQRQENNVPIFSSPFPLLLFFFSSYKLVTWHALSGLFLKFWGHTTFLFLSHGLSLCAFFRICGFDDPTCFPVDEAFSCYRVSCLWFQSWVHKPRSPGWLLFVRWHLMFVGPHYGTCCMSILRRPELWVGFCIVGKCVHPCF